MSRKRAAPGADAVGPPNYQQIQSNQWQPSSTTDQSGSYTNVQDYGINPYQSALPSLQSEPSNQLTRRGTNQMGLQQYGGDGGDWSVQQYNAAQQPDNGNDGSWLNNDDELERQAEKAEQAAIRNRKSIPPFVQKLRSFVDDEKNSELIRWSNDGDSFVVLDEDEFAKKLIPELFKHNKYPSFVRQLNMYGFHKRVALSDNSMRASERKSKSPSEYHNPYFKRGRPRLMWLIQKPKSNQTGKKNANGEDVDDDEVDVEVPGTQTTRNRQSMVLPTAGKVLSQEAASQLHQELSAIRRNQSAIQEEVRKLREENDMMQNRAAAYQAIHQRHENSINAILSFLATVFRNQIEGRDTASLANLFPQAAPREQQQGDRVVDLADYDGRESSIQSNTPRPARRPLLLEAPQSRQTPGSDAGQNRVSSISTPTTSEFPRDASAAPTPSASGDAAQIKREPSAEVGQSDDILSFLNQQATGPGGNISRLNYPQALSQLQSANSRSPMSTPQRNDLLRLMANGAGGALTGDMNNALISPSPPPIPGPSDPQWEARSKDIEALERSIREQDDRFNNVSQLLGPLSPSGSINLFDGDNNVPPPSDFDLDWLNHSQNDSLSGIDGNDNPFFDFQNFDANNGANATGHNNEQDPSSLQPGGYDGNTDNSGAPSPAGTVGTVNTIEEGNNDGIEGADPPHKRQRVM